MDQSGKIDIVVKPLNEENIDLLANITLENLMFRVITEPDQWLETSYKILAETFDASVLDPYERYVEWLEQNRQGKHRFPFLMMAAHCNFENQAVLVGVISGNIMQVEDFIKSESKLTSPLYIYAIGHQVTSPLLRSKGVKGVGTRLLNRAFDEARRWIDQRGGIYGYSILEAETESIGFYSKQGYLWPQGVHYWQPPLEFDSEGIYLHSEVPELLMIKPELLKNSVASIEKGLLKNIIATLYLNWSLAKYRTSLPKTAFQRAENYVMGELFNRLCKKMPIQDHINLVHINTSNKDNRPKHVRTIALNSCTQYGFETLKAPRSKEISDFDELLQAMKDMAFGARTLGDAAEVLYAMATDSNCKVVLTLAGAVTIAKVDGLIAEMIEHGLVHCIVSTGAILCHGFNAERGSAHFKVPEGYSDTWLFEQGFDRIYDTIEMEYALDELEEIIHTILSENVIDQPVCSNDIINQIGKYLVDKGSGQGIIQSAYLNHVHIFIPAFTDSEIGLDFALFNYYRRENNLPEIRFDPFIDFERYYQFIKGTQTRGIITLGGGVPRNWAQQIGPYIDAIERRENAIASNTGKFKYGVRICPDPPYWGGLSGATYSEGISWGKFMAKDEGGQFAEVMSDFSLVFPILIKGLLQRLEKRR